MAHNILENDSMMAVARLHGMALVVTLTEDPKSGLEALQFAKMDWEVERLPMFLADGRQYRSLAMVPIRVAVVSTLRSFARTTMTFLESLVLHMFRFRIGTWQSYTTRLSRMERWISRHAARFLMVVEHGCLVSSRVEPLKLTMEVIASNAT